MDNERINCNNCQFRQDINVKYMGGYVLNVPRCAAGLSRENAGNNCIGFRQATGKPESYIEVMTDEKWDEINKPPVYIKPAEDPQNKEKLGRIIGNLFSSGS